uniref:DUF3575 domain-containing protein n=1 Tax=Roseihalotalea indica TaxID=2867963 RepID=A0AA49JHH3_9BACT|nr:hypothetical protein K4G66_06040 [Tunicatimonas sp. TK19036]
MTKKLLITITLFAYYFTSYAQGDVSDSVHVGLKKNVVHISAGFVPLRGAYNLNYERMIAELSKSFINSILLRVGGGEWGAWAVGGSHLVGGVSILTGSRKGHVEFNAGLTRLYDRLGYEGHIESNLLFNNNEPPPPKSQFVYYYPAGALGYRYQKPGGHFVFRTGIGYPETIYIGFGAAF